MKKIKNEDFANAIKAIKEGPLFKREEILEKEYDGYVASVGASVINSGLLPTLSFYTDVDKKERGKVRRYKLLQVIFQVMDTEAAHRAGDSKTGLLDHVLQSVFADYATAKAGALGAPDKQILRKKTQDFLRAAVAVKLAMRNFEQSDS